MRMSSNSTNLSVVSHFNIIIEISVINYLYLPNFSFILYFITKILAFHVVIVFRMMTSSNLIDLTVDSNFNAISEINIISYLYIENFSFILNFVTKLLAISYFHCLKMMTSSNSIDFDS